LRKTTEVKHKQKETGREACLSDANVWGGESQVFLGKTQNKRKEIQSVIVCTVPGKENRTHLTCQKGSCSLDKRIKNHYTTNRKGAVRNGQLLARSVKKIDRLSLDT
jgi:hypothetical protein